MIVRVTHLKTGYAKLHPDVQRMIETEDRVELVEYRRKGHPLCSTSYHKQLYRVERVPEEELALKEPTM